MSFIDGFYGIDSVARCAGCQQPVQITRNVHVLPLDNQCLIYFEAMFGGDDMAIRKIYFFMSHSYSFDLAELLYNNFPISCALTMLTFTSYSHVNIMNSYVVELSSIKLHQCTIYFDYTEFTWSFDHSHFPQIQSSMFLVFVHSPRQPELLYTSKCLSATRV